MHCYPPKVGMNDTIKMMQILRTRMRTGIVSETMSSKPIFITLWFFELLSFFSPGGSATTVATGLASNLVLPFCGWFRGVFCQMKLVFFIRPQRCGLSRKYFPLIFSLFLVFVFPPLSFSSSLGLDEFLSQSEGEGWGAFVFRQNFKNPGGVALGVGFF